MSKFPATLLTLIVTPVAYLLFDDMAATSAWKASARAYAVTHHPA